MENVLEPTRSCKGGWTLKSTSSYLTSGFPECCFSFFQFPRTFFQVCHCLRSRPHCIYGKYQKVRSCTNERSGFSWFLPSWSGIKDNFFGPGKVALEETPSYISKQGMGLFYTLLNLGLTGPRK